MCSRIHPNGVVQRFIARHGDSLTSKRVAVAFSGGVDSLALAICCTEAEQAAGVTPVLLHVDHGQRRSSSQEAEIAEALARDLGLEFARRRLKDIPGSEDALRSARYRALAGMMAAAGIGVLLTAHHADDQAETVLLNLIRGSGLEGAAGIRDREAFTVPGTEEVIDLRRPLLAERRRNLEALVRARGLTPIHDPSNDDLTFARNRIRHLVIPELLKINPAATSNISSFARLAGQDGDHLNHETVQRIAEVRESRHLDIGWLRGLRSATIANRVIRGWVHYHSGLILSRERTEAVAGLANEVRNGARIEIGGGWSISRQWPHLELTGPRT